MAILEVHNLAATHSNCRFREVLRDVTFTLDTGDVLLVHGHNGSGKSTLLKVLAGLIPATLGNLIWAGKRVANVAPGGRLHPWVGLLMQADNVFSSLSVHENINLAAQHRRIDHDLIQDRIVREFPLLEPIWNKRAGLLSGGQRKILAMAMSMINDPPLLLLDEPLAGLSSQSASAVTQILEARKKAGAVLILVEHSFPDAGKGLISLHAEMMEGRLSKPRSLLARDDREGTLS